MANIPGIPFKLNAEDMGVPDYAKAVRSGLENFIKTNEARYAPQMSQADLQRKLYENVTKGAEAKYAEPNQQMGLKQKEAAINHMAAQTALSRGNVSLIPYYKKLYEAQANEHATKASQARQQQDMFAQLRENVMGNGNQMSNNQNQGTDYMSALRGQELPQGNAPRPVQQNIQLPGGVNKEDILRALTYKAFDLKAPSGKESAYTGAAREGLDMARLKNQYGENSEEYKNAQSIQHAKEQRNEDISEIRQRQMHGLKPGDTEIKDPNTGETIGFRKQTTEKQKEAAKNLHLFNGFYPLVVNGGAPFVGSDAAYQLQQTISKAKSNPIEREKLINFMIAEKGLTNSTITEAARFSSGKTNQTYNRYADSLKTENITPKLKKWLKEYGIDSEINREVGKRWQETMNKFEKEANQRIPATMDYYFDPDKQFANQLKEQGNAENNNSDEERKVTIKNRKTGISETVTVAEARRRGVPNV